MCLLVFGIDAHPDFQLIVAANRDEFYARPAASARFWPDTPNLLAGRDLTGGGTWLGVTRQGRFAALTNYRDPARAGSGRPSRGQIVRSCLQDQPGPEESIQRLARSPIEFAGFSLVAGDLNDFFYYSNRESRVRSIAPGAHTLSNHLLDTPWPKSTRAVDRFRSALRGDPGVLPEALLAILADPWIPADDALPDTGIGLELERALGAIFVRTPDYGTRCSTVVLVDRQGGVRFVERTYPGDDSEPATVSIEYRLEALP